MPSLKDIRNRITSVKKTQKTTSAMKMVSAAKLRRAEIASKAANPYSAQLKRVVSSLSSRFGEDDNPLFREPTSNRTGVILLTSDRGLCGGFNTNLCRTVLRQLTESGVSDAQFVTVGRKGNDFIKRSSHTIIKHYGDTPPGERPRVINEVVGLMMERFVAGELDRVLLVYSHFVSVLTQQPTIETLFPIEPPEAEETDEREVLFEPSPEQILGALLQKYVQNCVFTAWLDILAGEHAARMTSMEAATKNAGEMIDKLQLYYNRSRQAAITTELIEIISGSESL
ncbi:MAG TPA: ATP synthase F1 subunit gamma [Deltaproteobacteria bacterium]|jgi:F-type H+-transporting ATPase subunit gamma|nr:ATP synthase F1 subunit gamma [Deltaproteobacteria bacterium]|tara:strand:- start:1963 stop:2814 length:852 start_codon:yes stop_codon:yes gene_type:complete